VRTANEELLMDYQTRFASLDDYEKGGVEVIDDDPRNYAFSNIFEVASHAAPFEHVAVAKNFEYVLEAVRVEGTSPWRSAAHDQSALVMDGEVEFEFRTLGEGARLADSGSAVVPDDVAESPMGTVRARRGHLTLLPAGRAAQDGRPAT